MALMSLRSNVARLRRNALTTLARRNVSIPSDRPLVSFSFDDFPRTALTVGGTILKSAGARGTYYVAVSLMNMQNELGPHFCLEDLHNLLASGHELASHTHSHVHGRSTPVVRYSEEVEKGYYTLKEIFGLNASRHFAYPYGEITFLIKRSIGPKMESCRGVFPGINGPNVDLNLLRANGLYGGADQLAAAKALVEENRRKQSWLIFYTHDVQLNPSPYGCTPALFQQVVDAAIASGARITTIGEAVSMAR